MKLFMHLPQPPNLTDIEEALWEMGMEKEYELINTMKYDRIYPGVC